MEKTTHVTSELNINNIKSFLEDIESFIFDCDGVLWRADEAVENAAQTIAFLREQGKKVIFLTNNSTKTRNDFLHKIKSFGIDCNIDEVFSSSYGAQVYLSKINFQQKLFMIGEKGLEEELRPLGLEIIKNFEKTNDGIDNVQHIEPDHSIGAVIIGMDTSYTYQKGVYAHKLLAENPNILFIATNTDPSYPVKNGKSLPGAGSIVTMIATSTGRKPNAIMGKPEQLLLDLILESHSLNRAKTCVVGDRMDTDILFGVRGNTKTLLVYTGVTKKEELPSFEYQPQYDTRTIGDLFTLFQKL
ncbi:hypothetical protein CYY_002004 [Polysphondylium violaceum]|uniref:4-nitrophenylphosphatase n=1 Tax=Polysphondylium violaceum TaxID=133409 RepID=A0A8J4Q8F6_9MYCE|nr:hypothetical protein CYY_002004 [Polysphondylium violaceum]